MDKFQSFVLHGSSGAELEVLAYGGKVKRLSVPDRDGRCANVAMSLDFSKPTRVGARRKGEYDHNWVLRSQDGSLALAATAEDAATGRRMETWTTEKGIQFYSGYALNANLKDQFGRALFPCAAFAFETQAHPDSINKPSWPDTVLRPGQVFRSVTEYRFTCT